MDWRQKTTIVVALLQAGCAALPQPDPSPTIQSAGRPYGQLVIHSDFRLPESHRLIREIVAERDDVSRTLELPTTEEPIHVHLFRDGTRYANYMRQRYPAMPDRRAFFVETDTQLLVYAHWGDRVAEDLRHEVAHGYLHAAVGQLPLWLDEGLAEYFEVPRGHDGLNRPHLDLLLVLQARGAWSPDLERLERLTDFAELSQRDYAESWAWVHFLLTSDSPHRQVLQSALAELRNRGTTEPISERLATLHVEPGSTLVEHLKAIP